jgi:hypothetical protein
MDKEKLTEIIRLHKLYLDDDPAGERADLQGADLRGAYFVIDLGQPNGWKAFAWLKAGALMALVLYPDGTKPFSFSAYLGTFTFSSGPQAGAVKCSCNFRSTGVITQPTS